MTAQQHDVVVVGGGNAGISLAARLQRLGVDDVAVVDARTTHHYRPLLSYVGAGQATMADLERPQRDVIPDGCTWVEDRVVAVDPDASVVRTRGGRTLGYRTLVLCPGLLEDWDATPGLVDAYADGWAASTFVADSAPRVWPALTALRSGSVVFTMPPEPAPCGATALKPLLMACEHWQRTGVLGDLTVHLVLPAASALGVPAGDEQVEWALAAYGVQVLREAQVEAVDHAARSVSVVSPAGPRTLEDVAFAHVVPHYRAPAWIAEAGLATASSAGLVDVDPETLRHRRHPAIWSLGDVADLGIRPSGGALRKQVDVLADNIVATAGGAGAGTDDDLRRYDGYTVMPITVDRRRLLLVEVDRAGQPSPSAPFPDLTRPRRLTWAFDRYGLVQVYYRRILRGKV
ncbi:MAG: FAD/NAD(P)-binding oxidoreductase [Nocardioides sp.]|nr:FAD/NAD(P)-binding oxidoreductase [Nocardioides sp.]